MRSWDVPKLFIGVAILDHPTTLKLLDEWFESADSEKIEAASKLLSEAPHDFVFTHRAYVVRVLECAWRVSEDCYNRVSSNFATPVISEMKTGSHGQAFPQDERHRDAASAAMNAIEAHSPGWRFYQGLHAHAESQIEHKRLSDEDLEDEYLLG